MEHLDVMMCQDDGVAQFVAYQFLRLVHLCLRHCQALQLGLVELQLILLHGLVATSLDISQYRSHRVVQLCEV